MRGENLQVNFEKEVGTMEKKQSFVEKLRLYEQLGEEIDGLTGEKQEKENSIKTRFDALGREIREFCTSQGFLSIMQVLCRINAGKLVFSPTERKISYMGRVPRTLPYDFNSCFTVKEEAKRMMLSVKSGNPKDEAVIARLCVGYLTLVPRLPPPPYLPLTEIYRQSLTSLPTAAKSFTASCSSEQRIKRTMASAYTWLQKPRSLTRMSSAA